MTDAETTRIGKSLAALEATFRTECEHITKRLDSHSQDIRKLTVEVNNLVADSAVIKCKDLNFKTISDRAWSAAFIIAGSVIGGLVTWMINILSKG